MEKRTIKVSFKGRWELFVIAWKYGRKFPDYSIKQEMQRLFFPKKMEVLIG